MSNSSDARSSSRHGQLAQPLLVEQRQGADPDARARAAPPPGRRSTGSARAARSRTTTVGAGRDHALDAAGWDRGRPADGLGRRQLADDDAGRSGSPCELVARGAAPRRGRRRPRRGPGPRPAPARRGRAPMQTRNQRASSSGRAEHDEPGQQGVAGDQLDDRDRAAAPPAAAPTDARRIGRRACGAGRAGRRRRRRAHRSTA